MFKEIRVHACFGNRTGYQIHASNFFPALDTLLQERGNGQNDKGEVHISLLDVVSASQITEFPPSPSILMTVWESTQYPDQFIHNLKHYDQLWLVSEWERSCAIQQGIPEEFVKVVPEGVDPDRYKPPEMPTPSLTFNFLHIGQWQPRKSTKEIIESWLKAFPADDYPDLRLYLSVDTLFPSDAYKSTDERLSAHGFTDPRIISIEFKFGQDYMDLLSTTHVHVTCSRSEGWGLPIIETMAYGIPTIVADWGGSTEYHDGAIKVSVPTTRKPHGIYGNWDVPGEWGEPDYSDLVEKLKYSYYHYDECKKAALETSTRIRTQFSWKAAAEKAYNILSELHSTIKDLLPPAVTIDRHISTLPSPESEAAIKSFARSRGYEVTNLKPISALFAIDCWPDSQEKMNTLTETIWQVHQLGFDIMLVSHYPLPVPIQESVEYYIYDKQDILSGDDKPIYQRTRTDGTLERTPARVEYHGVAALNNIRNAIDFCRGRYDWLYEMTADMEVDLNDWLNKVLSSTKPLIFIPYEGSREGIGGGLLAGRVEVFDRIWPRLSSWEEYAALYPTLRFVTERWLYSYWKDRYPEIDSLIDWIDVETVDRFDNVDHEIWEDDDFQCHFIEGPYINIIGLSRREYEVIFSVDGVAKYALNQKVGMWSRPSQKYYQNWTVKALLNGVEKFSHNIDLTNKRVLISMGSKALGDTIAWMPYVEQFRIKHNCHVILSGWWLDIFDYPDIEFVQPGSTVENIYASYEVGCYDNQLDKNVVDWRTVPLQKVAADILGLDYEPLRAKLKEGNLNNPPSTKPYACFSEFSTMQNKLWNREGAWQKVADYLNSIDITPTSISFEPSTLNNVVKLNQKPISETIAAISGASFYIGLNHGPAWIAYALDIPVIMITGVSEPWNDFPMAHRISVPSCTPGCFNDPSIPIDRKWDWCPREKNYICTADITEDMVIEAIKDLVEQK